jgi:hypothetical protein
MRTTTRRTASVAPPQFAPAEQQSQAQLLMSQQARHPSDESQYPLQSPQPSHPPQSHSQSPC